MSATNRQHRVQRIFTKIGISNATKIAETLQGSIWRGSETHDNTTSKAVIKITNINMHEEGITYVNNKKLHIQENILLEQGILKYLTECENCPKSIVKFRRFFQTNTNYYLIMEDGGGSLFDFILKVHHLIRSGDIAVSEWRRVVKVIYKQMISAVEYLHSKNVAHNDISIENFLINDVAIQVVQSDGGNKIKINTDDIQIRLCDFGLAQLFTGNDFESNLFVGKKGYKSPEVMAKKKRFDARKNDIWCLGVGLFMMLMGTSPWTSATKSDKCFRYIMSGKLVSLLVAWDMLHYCDSYIIDLFESIFQYEADRMCFEKMKQHPWLYTES